MPLRMPTAASLVAQLFLYSSSIYAQFVAPPLPPDFPAPPGSTPSAPAPTSTAPQVPPATMPPQPTSITASTPYIAPWVAAVTFSAFLVLAVITSVTVWIFVVDRKKVSEVPGWFKEHFSKSKKKKKKSEDSSSDESDFDDDWNEEDHLTSVQHGSTGNEKTRTMTST